MTVNLLFKGCTNKTLLSAVICITDFLSGKPATKAQD